MESLNIFIRSIFIDNMVFAFFFGMCSYIAVSKSVKTALGLGLAVTFVMVMTVPLNYFLVYPAYAAAFGGMELIVGAYQTILPSVNGLLECLLIFNMPFTLVKGLIVSLITFLIYKPLSPVLHGRNR